ncbi:hypothetical protein TspCOW1_06840 [Thiohalobacter sp. COW1]|uniref:hypothetical protein n=1 Tax=Thiohalobacter sp. COW1 TaxID=2795687 RepID=UPI0019164765|nr:hypothetical protein [Thiohalobacter sp. COW1]BCO30581.1 hypothetical protein TspCOW1_06840 [Thiohalobacter sp. COW1]
MTTTPLFSREPGAHERHLRRRYENPLFPPERRRIGDRDVLAARRRDQQHLEAFLERFHQVVQRAVNLDANVQSDVILELKEELDRCYEEAAGLAGDQARIKEAIVKLVGTIMRAVRQGAEHDAVALRKLDEEDQARSLHYELLEEPLVADLLNPEDVIPEGDLIPALLGCEPAVLEKVLTLFSPEQMTVMIRDARSLLENTTLEAGVLALATTNLVRMEAAATEQAGTHTVN